MRVNHRFIELSKQDSGKQHCFSWHGAEGNFLFHAMYQSGADMIPTTDGATAPRGEVLRLQTRERTQENKDTLTLAPSKDAEEGTLALHVFDQHWGKERYEQLARHIEQDCDLSPEQVTAAYAQLASLYNLMATQFGKLFELQAYGTQDEDLRRLITDPKLEGLSAYFQQLALSRMQGEVTSPMLDDAIFAEAPAARGDLCRLNYWHGIEATERNKNHLFEMKMDYEADDGEVTRDIRLLKAKYQSGTWGETVMFTFPLLLAGNDKEIMIPVNVRTFEEEGSPKSKPIAAVEQYRRLAFLEKQYWLAPDQEGGALAMLAAVYRLAATHYQGAYKDIEITDEASLSDYIRARDYTREAEKLEHLAGIRLGHREKQRDPMMEEVEDERILGADVIEKLQLSRAGIIQPRDVEDYVMHKMTERLHSLRDMAQPMIDPAFMEQRDYERAVKGYFDGSLSCLSRDTSMQTYFTGRMTRRRAEGGASEVGS